MHQVISFMRNTAHGSQQVHVVGLFPRTSWLHIMTAHHAHSHEEQKRGGKSKKFPSI